LLTEEVDKSRDSKNPELGRPEEEKGADAAVQEVQEGDEAQRLQHTNPPGSYVFYIPEGDLMQLTELG